MRVANNMVMQEKLDSLAAKNLKWMKKMAVDQAVNAKYHHVTDTAMSITRATKETDAITLQTQWLTFTASQAANTEDQFASIRR